LSFQDTDDPKYHGSFASGGRGFEGVQVTESENHPTWRAGYKTGQFLGDKGGDFTMRKQFLETTYGSVLRDCDASYYDPRQGRNMRVAFKGGIYPSGLPSDPYSSFGNSSDAELNAFGTTAIARCRPNSNIASAAAALIELYHEGLPHLVGSSLWSGRTLAAKNAGQEYLNVEFGFKPLANDIAKFAYGVVYFDKVRAQIERDSGKVVRRRYDFPPIERRSTRTVASLFVRPSTEPDSDFGNVGPDANNGAKTILDSYTRIERWFSGAFTYYVPKQDAFGMLSQAQKLLGLEITPDVLWQVTPWSWAVDWFTNAGDVISNLQAFTIDGLLLRYGYIMEHTVTKNTYYHQGPTGKCWGDSCYPTPLVFVTETKVRRRATPFGFGLKLSDFTVRQSAIAAALGLSRT